MSVTAELHDGRVLEFPDGTDPAVVQATVKKVLNSSAAPISRADQIPGVQPERQQAPDRPTSIGEKLYGGTEAALSALTAIPAAVTGAAAGLGSRLMGGDQDQTARNVMGAMTFQPRTETGQDYLRNVGNVIDASKIAGLPPSAAVTGMATPVRAAGQAARTEAELAGSAVKAGMQKMAPTAGIQTAAEAAPARVALQEARQAGYAVPPSQAPGARVGKAIEGLIAREAPTERVFSLKNAANTDRLVRSDFGINPSVPVNDETFSAIRSSAGKAYQDVKDSGIRIKSDDTFKAQLAKITESDYGKAASEYGDLLNNDAVTKLVQTVGKDEVSANAAVEMVKEMRRRATKNIKNWDDLEKQDLGYAQRSAANAIESLVERNLSAQGKPGLVDEWRKARVTIAKSYDAEAAWDGQHFSAKELAKMHDKGSPLTEGMLTAAKFAQSFPKAAQDATKMAQKAGFSQYDLWAGVGTAAATGNPLGIGVAAVPWLTQRALLTDTAQNALVGGGLRK